MLAHEKVTLEAVAKAVAQFKGYEFGGWHDNARRYSSGIFFVADDTLMLDEAASLGIRSPNDLFGGVGEWARCQSGATRRQRHGHEPNGPDLGAKRLELLKEILPRLSRVAVLWNARIRILCSSSKRRRPGVRHWG